MNKPRADGRALCTYAIAFGALAGAVIPPGLMPYFGLVLAAPLAWMLWRSPGCDGTKR